MLSRLSLIARHLTPTAPLQRTPFSLLRRPTMPSPALTNLRAPLHTAACLIIGDEVLNGKTTDTNSTYMAKFCFSLGIDLARIEVIADSPPEIAEAVTRMSSRYDFVVTSGGIGPTADDMTYAAIAGAFGLPLELHAGAFERMKRLSRPHKSQPDFSWTKESKALEAKKRMVILPKDQGVEDGEQVLFVDDALWVPVAVVNGNVHILPGVPRLFEILLDGLRPRLEKRVRQDGGLVRIMFATPLAESEVADYLTELTKRVEERGIKVGSYPRWGKGRNTVTLTGRDKEYMEGLVEEVEREVKGKRVQKEDELDEEAESDKDT